MKGNKRVPSYGDIENYLASKGQCKVGKTGVQSVPNGVATVASFDADHYDTAGMHDTVTNNSRITVPASGIFLIQLVIHWAAGWGGTSYATLYKNGAPMAGLMAEVPGAGGVTSNHTFMLKLLEGDYIEVYVTQGSGGNLNLDLGTTMLVHYMGKG